MGASLSVRSRRRSEAWRQRPLPELPPSLAPLPFARKPCSVCLELDTEFPSETPTRGCTHPIDVCASCVEAYICSKIEGGTLTLKCPSLSCPGQMEVAEMQKSLAGKHKEALERFCELKVRFSLQTEAALFWCKAPECGAAQIHVGGAAWPIVTCQKCSARACFVHDTVWHEGKTCAQYTQELKQSPRRELETKKSEIWISSNTKTCPGQGCGRPIQKTHGCDHMTCRKPGGCGHEFCWECLASYKEIRANGNKSHAATCRYYA